MTIRIGILSDTHLNQLDDHFRSAVAACFAGVDLVLHAGDLTDVKILAAFQGIQLKAVHGNMCGASSRRTLPAEELFKIGDFTIALTHGHRFGYHDLEGRLFTEFPEADCIIYGHTHRPVCHLLGNTLMINPGSFMGSGRYGSPGTYAILTVAERLSAGIMPVPEEDQAPPIDHGAERLPAWPGAGQ